MKAGMASVATVGLWTARELFCGLSSLVENGLLLSDGPCHCHHHETARGATLLAGNVEP